MTVNSTASSGFNTLGRISGEAAAHQHSNAENVFYNSQVYHCQLSVTSLRQWNLSVETRTGRTGIGVTI